MTHAGACWELGTSARIIDETACGFLPTPTTQGNEHSPSMQKWPAHRALMELVDSLPTPLARDWRSGKLTAAVMARNSLPLHETIEARLSGMLPTPTATAYGYNKGGAQGRVGPDRPSVDILAKGAGLGGGRLALREWMMGWVIGWTALEPLAMDRFRLWLRLHGGC